MTRTDPLHDPKLGRDAKMLYALLASTDNSLIWMLTVLDLHGYLDEFEEFRSGEFARRQS